MGVCVRWERERGWGHGGLVMNFASLLTWFQVWSYCVVHWTSIFYYSCKLTKDLLVYLVDVNWAKPTMCVCVCCSPVQYHIIVANSVVCFVCNILQKRLVWWAEEHQPLENLSRWMTSEPCKHRKVYIKTMVV